MTYPRTLPPPFSLGMRLGYVWDSSFPVSTEAYGAGNRQMELTEEQMQRFQTRLAEWDVTVTVEDDVNPGPTYTTGPAEMNTGDDDDVSRIKDVLTGDLQLEVEVPVLPAGGGVVVARTVLDLSPLTNADQTLYYPTLLISGHTLALWDSNVGPFTQVELEISSSPLASDWISWGTCVVSDGTGDTFPVDIFVEPNPDPYAGTGTLVYYYVLADWTFDPTLYIT